MIQANEFRVMNWVLVNGKPNVIRGGGIAAIESSRFEVQPIPLTPEILAKAGFKFADYLSTKIRYRKHNFQIDLSKKMWFLHGYRGNPIGMQYLHQLQNLYFALTGEELEIKL